LAGDDSHLQFFRNQAARWARNIRAIEEPTIAASCVPRVGPTGYDSGRQIFNAISAASLCLKSVPIKSVHLFGHSYPDGIIGAAGSFSGLYRSGMGVNEPAGGRTVDDMDTGWLHDSVTFVLHGCNTALGDVNFARSLYERLSSGASPPRLSSPTVYGHHVSVCAGQERSWREYSARSPNGRIHLRTIPVYAGGGGCA
jgi:hypothetical protein